MSAEAGGHTPEIFNTSIRDSLSQNLRQSIANILVLPVKTGGLLTKLSVLIKLIIHSLIKKREIVQQKFMKLGSLPIKLYGSENEIPLILGGFAHFW